MTAQELAQSMHTPQVELINNQPATTSLNIAQVFGKNHKEVLRTIEKKLPNLDADFTERNFALSDYQDETGKSNKLYILTQDGFSFLVMGFTGAKADHFKVVYINEFNRMREALNSQNQALPQKSTKALTDKTDRIPLARKVKKWSKQDNKTMVACYRELNSYMGLKSSTLITVEELPRAIAFIDEKLGILRQESLLTPIVETLPATQISKSSRRIKASEKLIALREKYLIEVNQMYSRLAEIEKEIDNACRVPFIEARNKLHTGKAPLAHEPFIELLFRENKKLSGAGKEMVDSFYQSIRIGLSLALMQDM